VGTSAADILGLLSRDVVTWRPDKGDAQAIAGTVVNVSVTAMQFGAIPIIEVDDGTTVWRVFGMGTVLQNEVGFKQVGETYVTNVKAGDRIGLRDQGRIAGKSELSKRNPYRSVRVIHQPRGGAGPSVAAVVSAPAGADDIPFD
jgi:hypothetical protein